MPLKPPSLDAWDVRKDPITLLATDHLGSQAAATRHRRSRRMSRACTSRSSYNLSEPLGSPGGEHLSEGRRKERRGLGELELESLCENENCQRMLVQRIVPASRIKGNRGRH